MIKKANKHLFLLNFLQNLLSALLNVILDALRLILNGRYKVTYKLPVPVVVNKEQFTLRIKTSWKNAIILAKVTKESSDKLRLEIKDSTFVTTSYSDDGKGE